MRAWHKLLAAGVALGSLVPAAHAATISVTTTTDELGRTTRFEFDSRNRLT